MSKRLFAWLLVLAGVLSITAVSQDRPLTTTFNDQLVDHPANLLTRINMEVRAGNYEPHWLQEAATEVADYMLFVDEAPPNRIEGSTRFAAAFVARGPRDEKGCSLRQLSLDGRLLQYPCSYMIYSAPFDSLPEKAKAAIYDRMSKILSGQDNGSKYSRLSLADRRVIVEILTSTKKHVPDYFQIAALK